MSARAYRARGRTKRSEETRERIKTAVRELLAEGAFHESTVEQVADRAGVARATVYQHFRSRLELVDAICETLDQNPALRRIRETVKGPDVDTALTETVAESMRFWSSEDPVLRHLYGVASIDPAAQDLIDRQRSDRRGELERLVHTIARAGRLRAGTNDRRALSLLLVLTSYETFRELREADLTDRQLTTTLQQAARDLLLV
ncbi:MAG TPA: TetR/AcrR family transcriptional regulator [Gaiellaceae bacterium]|jgi:AcrR family transcriptional regulator